MITKNRLLIHILFSIIISTTALLALLIFLPGQAFSGELLILPATHSQEQTDVVSGTYQGMVAITIPVQLGVIDLGFGLERQGNALSGQVSITDTLVYAGAPAISGSVTGLSTSHPTFQLASEIFTDTIAGRLVQRSFMMSGDVQQNGAILSGVYTETITGLTPDPMIVVGDFMLSRPVALGTRDNFLFLPVVRR